MSGVSEARVLDAGYRPYEGPRFGRWGAARALVRYTIRRALGIRRSFAAKVLPVLTLLIAYVPAVLFLGLVAVLPTPPEGTLPTYPEYFGLLTIGILLFAVLVAPDVLCTDRRTGMLTLYLASPLTPALYLGAKVLAVVVVLGAVTLVPPLLLLSGFLLLGEGPAGPLDALIAVGRIGASGVVLSVVYGLVSLGVSAFTARRAVAAAGVVLVILGSGVVVGILGDALGGPEELVLLSVADVPMELVRRVFGVLGDHPGIATWLLAVSGAGWTLLAAVPLCLRYLIGVRG